MTRLSLIGIAIAALALAACSPAGAGGPGSSAAGGQALFATNCGECHGDDGSGTDEGPAILGHTADQVKEQVRTPEGDMEAIDSAKLSDADLEIIAAWIASQPGEEEAHPDIEVSAEEQTHLMAAYEAIEDYENMDRETAINHLNQASALASGEAADLYDELIEAIEAGKAGNARHELKELLGLMDMED